MTGWRTEVARMTVLVVVLLLMCAALRAQAAASGAESFSIAEQYLLRGINAERSAAGLPPVTHDPELHSAALHHALQMARSNTLTHQLRGEPGLAVRGSEAGAHFSRITENVAVGPSIPAMHDSLMRSAHHRENILDAQVNSVGVAVFAWNGSLWAVEDFSRTVEPLTLREQEERVTSLLRSLHVRAAPTQDARTTCSMDSGYTGPRPLFTMRYSTGNLSQLPEQLQVRMQMGPGGAAAVGACGSQSSVGGFTRYNIAILLYR